MRIMKKALSVLLIFVVALAFSVMPADSNAAAKKAKVKISKTKITMQVKTSKTIKITGTSKKVSWSVKVKKGKKLVTVKKKSKRLVTIKTKGKKKKTAVIKAGKKTGTCYVVAKVGKKQLKCKITIKKKKKPAKPDEGTSHGGNSDWDDEDFTEKTLSGTSLNLSEKFPTGQAATRAADETFINAMNDTSIRLLQQTIIETGKPVQNSGSDAQGNDGTGDPNGGNGTEPAESAADYVTDGNVLISPDSILTAMAMTENGAGKNSTTLQEIEDTFGGIDCETYNEYLSAMNARLTGAKSIKYHLADSIWYKAGAIRVKDSFLSKNAALHNAEIYEAPFNNNTLSDINNWVYNNTKGRIPFILDRLEQDDRIVLVNAIAFDGKWAEPYENTYKKTFYAADGTQQEADMLIGTESTYIQLDGGKGFVKPYEGDWSAEGTGAKLAFMALLPPENMTVEEYIAGLTGDELSDAYKAAIIRTPDSKRYSVNTWMPEFKYDFGLSMAKTLQKMGIKTAFTPAADFSEMIETGNEGSGNGPDGMSNFEPIYIGDVLHKTHIEVNKDGTKAAAATAVVGKAGSAPGMDIEHVDVHLDRPFVYAIIDSDTGIPLFIGYVKTMK